MVAIWNCPWCLKFQCSAAKCFVLIKLNVFCLYKISHAYHMFLYLYLPLLFFKNKQIKKRKSWGSMRHCRLEMGIPFCTTLKFNVWLWETRENNVINKKWIAGAQHHVLQKVIYKFDWFVMLFSFGIRKIWQHTWKQDDGEWFLCVHSATQGT